MSSKYKCNYGIYIKSTRSPTARYITLTFSPSLLPPTVFGLYIRR